MKNLKHVLRFTFVQHIRGKAYKNSTITGLVLCLLLPALIMCAIAFFGGGQAGEERIKSPAAVFVVDEIPGEADYGSLNRLGVPGYTDISYQGFGADFAAAAAAAEAYEGDSLLLWISQGEGGGYALSLLLPDASGLDSDDAYAYLGALSGGFGSLMLEKAGIGAQALEAPIVLDIAPLEAGGQAAVEEEEASPYEGTRELLSMLLPYLNIMVLYFLILFYGQGVANSVLIEKTSKLMDTFLVSVEPRELVLGKVLSIAGAGILQLVLWLAALGLSFWAGAFAVEELMGESLGIIGFFHALGGMGLGDMFTLPQILLSLGIILGGFLLYCALASVGGSLAGKQEDLSSTNMLFVMALIISFFCCLYAGGMDGMSSQAPWLVYVPFTAILVAPSRVLLGSVSLGQGLASLGIVLLSAFLVTLLAAKIYRMMSLYKGNPPSPKKILAMLREDR